MAKVKTQTGTAFKSKPKVSRPGVHSKTKTSKSKTADNYVKANRGQGR